jgi:hypothetical protein
MALRELRDAFQLWALRECAEGRPYPADHDWEVICQTAKQWGAPHAKSAFARAFKTLVDQKRIKPQQQPRPVEVTPEFRQRVAIMNASDVRIAYQRDPEFRKLWDAMSLEDDRSAS